MGKSGQGQGEKRAVFQEARPCGARAQETGGLEVGIVKSGLKMGGSQPEVLSRNRIQCGVQGQKLCVCVRTR